MEPRHSVGSGDLFHVDLQLPESGIPNAFANKQADRHVIGMHTALPVAIHELSLFCFAQTGFFPDLGDPSMEQSPVADKALPPGVRLILLTHRHGTDVDFSGERLAPVDPHRAAAAHYLTLLMMRFVWLHELAHGVLGHVDYVRFQSKHDDMPSLGLDELSFDEDLIAATGIDARALQCMEFEADSWALSKSIIIQRDGIENIEGIAALPADLRLRLTLFGIYAMTWLMETLASTSKRGRLNITHPAPYRRLEFIQNEALRQLGDMGLDAPVLTADTLRQFEAVLAQIGEQWLQTDRFDPISYRAVFDQLRDDLAPYRYLVRD